MGKCGALEEVPRLWHPRHQYAFGRHLIGLDAKVWDAGLAWLGHSCRLGMVTAIVMYADQKSEILTVHLRPVLQLDATRETAYFVVEQCHSQVQDSP